jgi:DNA-binding NtrC family response regulator
VDTKQQEDSARRLTGKHRGAAAHLRVVYGRSNAVVHELSPGGTSIGREGAEIRIDDDLVSRRHIRLVCGAAGWRVEDLGSRNGGYVDGHGFASQERVVLGDGALLRLGDSLFVFRLAPAPEADVDSDNAAFPGVSPGAREVRRRIALLAEASGHVLVLGETGTGKERVARAVAGPRQPFVAQNCGELSPDLARSELFGHVQGAFSGAGHAKAGLVEAAGDGALFLDEIGELALDVQADLLRFLEDSTYRPVGGQRTLRSGARVVAATNVDLDRAVGGNRFRRDLLARLRASNAPLELPALRDRREDIPGWARRFAREAGVSAETLWTAGALECLMLYPWPDNLRELRGVVRDLVANAAPPPWPTERLPARLHEHRAALRAPGEPTPVKPRVRVVPTREEIELALQETGGRMAVAAKQLGIERTKLYRLCESLGIVFDEHRATTQSEEG